MNDMNNKADQTGQPSQQNTVPSSNAQTFDSGCCQKMMSACKDMCSRFLDSRIRISYHMTSCVQKAGESGGTSTSENKSGNKQNGTQTSEEAPNTMVKQGVLELRPIDLTVGAVMVCAMMSLWHMIKKMCC